MALLMRRSRSPWNNATAANDLPDAVYTANDFGRMGGRPSHPELLDYLSNQFIATDVDEAVAPHDSAFERIPAGERIADGEIAMEQDAENSLLWKSTKRRLESEEIRDSMLVISGKLNPKIGGPSVLVPIDRDLVKMLKRPQYWVPTKDKSEYDRRTLYLIYKRNLQLPFMGVFDAPDMQLSCPRREQSSHALQALELLNGQMSNELAAAFAQRLEKERATNPARIDSGVASRYRQGADKPRRSCLRCGIWRKNLATRSA